MGLDTLLGYLIGSRTAILTLAGHPHTWLVGLVFVLSAGFAREYDGADLLHEPWHVLVPLGASLVSSFGLFLVLFLPSWLAGTAGPPFPSAYRAFLGVFWMTAPLAWLYAVPYERLLDPVSAVYANLDTLLLVSIWRVALMVRVGVVLFGLSPWSALFRVLAFADTVALIALQFVPFQIIEVMGGVRLSESETPVRSLAGTIACWGGVTFLVWWWLASITGNRHAWALPWREDLPSPAATDSLRSTVGHGAPVRWSLRMLAVASLAIWMPVLPFTQPEQEARWRVESAFRAGRLRDMLHELSARELADFPPHWEPPPRFLNGGWPAQVLDVWEAILQDEPAPWVRQHYLARLDSFVKTFGFWAYQETIIEKMAKALNQMPEGEALLQTWAADEDMRDRMWRLDPYLRPELRLQKNLKVSNHP